MPQFRKKPVVVEAVQYTEANEWPKGRCTNEYCLRKVPHVHSIHGDEPGMESVKIEHGDWIIQEPDGKHYYPCKPDIFAESYEEV